MKRWIKILIAAIATPIVLVILLVSIWIVMNWQGVIDPYQVGDPNAQLKVLIASQGTEFKNKLLNDLILQLQSDKKYISIIDVTSLEKENVSDWNVIVIIHTTRAHQMPKSVKNYLKKSTNLSEVILIATSGGGDEMVAEFEVDAISTASRLDVTDQIIESIIIKVDEILLNQTY